MRRSRPAGITLQEDPVTQALPTSDLLPALSGATADLADAVAPSIVQVHGRPRRPSSGFVVAPERVVTTSHSVQLEDGVRVRTHDGRLLEAELAGHAPGPDVVLLRVPGLDAPVVTGLDAPETVPAVRPGTLVVLAGRSWSGHLHVRLLAVSGVGGPVRAADGTAIDRVYSLPVLPYPGVSGSAVLDAHGNLAGLATAGLVRGRVLGLPTAGLRTAIEALEAKGTMARGFLGITTHAARLAASQSGPAGQPHGLVVVGVAPESPAAAQLCVGDVIVSAAGGPVSSPDDLLAVLGPDTVGAPLALRVMRGTAVVTLQVTVGARPARW
jgi:S1-C subfamily serine protease